MLLTGPTILVPVRRPLVPARPPPPRARPPLRRSPGPAWRPWWRRRVDALVAHGLQFGPDGKARFSAAGKALFAAPADPCCCSPCPSPGPSTAHDNTSAYTVSGFAGMTATGCPPASDTTGHPCITSTEPLWNGVMPIAAENVWHTGNGPDPGRDPPVGPWWSIAGLELYQAEMGIASDPFIDCPFWYLAIFACYRNNPFPLRVGPARLLWVGTKFDGATAAGSYFFNTFVEDDVSGPGSTPTCGGSHPAAMLVS